MKALRDWNHNGKDDLFDHVTDHYIYEKVFKEDKKKDSEYRPKNNMTYASNQTQNFSSENNGERWEEEHPYFTISMVLLVIISFFVLIADIFS